LLQEQRNVMPFLKLELEGEPEAHEQANNSIPLLSGNEPSLEPLVDEDEDGNINLWRVFFHLLQESKSQWPDSIGNFIDPTPNETLPRRLVDFNRPVKEQRIKSHLRRCLNAYLACGERPLGSPVPQADTCYVWASATFHGRVLGDMRESFKVTSSACVRANSTRNSSYVQFLREETIAFGEVSLFFTGYQAVFGARIRRRVHEKMHWFLRSDRRIDVNQGAHRARPARVKSVHSFWE